jgi:hypothetical protein
VINFDETVTQPWNINESKHNINFDDYCQNNYLRSSFDNQDEHSITDRSSTDDLVEISNLLDANTQGYNYM